MDNQPMCGRCYRNEPCRDHIHVYQSGGKWANECLCGEHMFNAIHRGVPECEHCGGSGILNVEERHEISTFGSEEVKVIWEQKASWCHGCENGKLWKGLLDG